MSFLGKVLVGATLLSILVVVPSLAVPNIINYQGALTDSKGNPIDGTVEVTFGLYDVVSGGTPLWSEVQEVDVVKGTYSVNLGERKPFDSKLFRERTLFLALEIGSEELAPRHEFSSVPSSFISDFANATDWRGIANIPEDIADGDNVGVDTNAATICSTGQYLDGDGVCRQMVTSVDGLSGGTITSEININGDVSTSGKFNYTGAQERWVNYPPSSFYPNISSSTTWSLANDMYGYTNSGGTFHAPVNIPDGSTIKSLTCYYYDNDAVTNIGSFYFYLTRRGNTEATSTTLAQGSTFTLNDFHQSTVYPRTDNTIDHVVSNMDNMYQIRIYWWIDGSFSTDVRFYGCKMKYEVNQAD